MLAGWRGQSQRTAIVVEVLSKQYFVSVCSLPTQRASARGATNEMNNLRTTTTTAKATATNAHQAAEFPHGTVS